MHAEIMAAGPSMFTHQTRYISMLSAETASSRCRALQHHDPIRKVKDSQHSTPSCTSLSTCMHNFAVCMSLGGWMRRGQSRCHSGGGICPRTRALRLCSTGEELETCLPSTASPRVKPQYGLEGVFCTRWGAFARRRLQSATRLVLFLSRGSLPG